ncbi:carboxymuconolactone decarboxylase family protein [Kribbella sancticallisti]|uniref:Carboxymuconolactone decarboxylase family protein n=1 Tax=Kribbella sancticallisti TaxID=460087 RepID=A0ABN2DMW4_9ACTN
MRRLQPLTPDEAPAGSSEILTDIASRHGGLGAMVATMAHSPAVLRGYLDLSAAIKRVKIPRALSEKLSLAVQEWIGCDLCLEAHSAAGRKVGLTDTDIELARQGTSVDAREAVLLDFAVRVLAEPSSIGDEDLTVLRDNGWSDRVITEVVGLVSLNLLTGAFNLVAGLHPEEAKPA